MKIVKANARGIKLAVQFLKAGKAVVYPTDTAYGLGVDATNVRAVRRLYKIKGRAYKKPTHVIVHNSSAAKKWAMMNRAAVRLMKKFWPGALTVVLPLTPTLSSQAGRGVRMLSAGTGTIGVRMPDNKIALELTKKLGRPITTPSANPAGGPAPYSVAAALKQFAGKKHQPDLYLDAGKLPERRPSTIIKIERNKIKILREGSCIIFPTT